jgi:hypothetical protein
MILHVFTKRTKGGELIHTGLEWKEGRYEAKSILSKPLEDGFEFSLPAEKSEEAQRLIKVTSAISGYEIFNNQGVCIEKYVTPVQYPVATEEGIEGLREEQDEDLLNKCS